MNRKGGETTPRATKKIWLEHGLEILAESGEAGLTIDNLAERLHLTKGSFYHHFHSRKDFSRQLLAYWEKRQTLDIIEASGKTGTSFSDRNAALIRLSRMDQSTNLEVAIRAWALRDPMVREYQERVDRIRLEYLQQLFGLITEEQDAAERMALIRYCMYVGTQQVFPRVKGQKLKTLYRELQRMFDLDYQGREK